MLKISNPEYKHNWEQFEHSVSLRSKRDPKIELEIISLAREGIPIKHIKKQVKVYNGTVDAVLWRARRGGIL